jgi:hypothetical protein
LGVSSKRDALVLDHFTLLNAINRIETGHLPVETHPAQAFQLADEGERDWMVDEIITADPGAMESEQVPVEAADNGDQIRDIPQPVDIT